MDGYLSVMNYKEFRRIIQQMLVPGYVEAVAQAASSLDLSVDAILKVDKEPHAIVL
jgi:hypothetical protein